MINLRVDEDTKAEFKEACKANNETMTDVLKREIHRYIFKHNLKDVPYGLLGCARNIQPLKSKLEDGNDGKNKND